MKSKNDICEIIKLGENETVEFKQSFDKETIDSVVAFANHKGGQIFIGIKDNGTLLGINYSCETLQKYINQIKVSTEPSLIVDIETILISEKNLMIITVDEFPVKPVNFKGRYFKRVKNSNHQMNLTEISNLYLRSLQLSKEKGHTSTLLL